MRIINLINSLIDKKIESGYDQGYKYTEFLNINTHGIETKEEMYDRYYEEIEKEYKENLEKLTILMYDVSNQVDVSGLNQEERNVAAVLRSAKYLFEQDRKTYNTEDDFDEDTYIEVIKKNNELTNILNKDINWDSSVEVYDWVQEIIPYINIQSVTANGIDKPIDKYLVELLEKHGYTAVKETIVTKDTVCRNLLANQIFELEKYGFVVSEYLECHSTCRRLVSSKVKEIAELEYAKELYNVTEQRLGYIKNRLESLDENKKQIIDEWYIKNKELDNEVKALTLELNDYNDNIEVTSKIYRTEETEAKNAYDLVVNEPTKENINKMFDLISRLHDKTYKDKLLTVAYTKLDKYISEGRISNDIVNFKNHTVGRPKKENIEKSIAKKEKKIREIKEIKEESLASIEESRNMLNTAKNKESKNNDIALKEIVRLKKSLKEKGYIDRDLESKKIDLTEYENEKKRFTDKIKEFFNKLTKKDKEDDSIVTISETDESLIDFVPIDNITKVNKELKTKLDSDLVKSKISSGLNYIDLIVKTSAKEIGFYAGGVLIAGLTLYNVNKNLEIEPKVVDTIEMPDNSIYEIGENIEIDDIGKGSK